MTNYRQPTKDDEGCTNWQWLGYEDKWRTPGGKLCVVGNQYSWGNCSNAFDASRFRIPVDDPQFVPGEFYRVPTFSKAKEYVGYSNALKRYIFADNAGTIIIEEKRAAAIVPWIEQSTPESRRLKVAAELAKGIFVVGYTDEMLIKRFASVLTANNCDEVQP